MEAYRDQYATLFNNGRNVAVIGISVDADTTLASWARDEDFPIVFASDPGSKVGQLYGSRGSGRQSRASAQTGFNEIKKGRGSFRGFFF
jgi:peroxiredoxin